MGAINLGKHVPAVATLASLVLVPNALGVGARAFPGLFLHVSNWIYPSARIQFFSILAVVLAFAFVFYLFLTRKFRAQPEIGGRDPRRDSRRRFLPPFEILLLQLGNFSFLVFAFILLVLVCGLFFSILRAAVDSPWLATNNLDLSLAIAATGVVLTLRPTRLEARSLEGRVHSWLSWSTLCAVALAGFGLVAMAGGWGPLRIHLGASELDPRTLGLLHASLLACLALGRLVTRAAWVRASTAEERRPLAWLVSGLILVGIANCGLSALLLHAVFLTLHGHLAEL